VRGTQTCSLYVIDTLSPGPSGPWVIEVLPAGTPVPLLGYVLVVALAFVAVALALRWATPRVTDRVVVAFAPWMVAGSGLYVLYQVGAIPRIVAPLFGSPAVYVSVGIVAGGFWAGTAAAGLPTDRWRIPSVPGVIVLMGSVAAAVVVGWVLFVGARGGLTAFWPAVGVVVTGALTAAVWVGLRRVVPKTRITGAAGGLCVFGHALDSVSTAVGIDILGFNERSAVPQMIIEVAAGFPTAAVIGAGWLFILVKLALAAAVVAFLSSYVREKPTEGYLLLGAVAAIGLGPGAHNLLLFTIISP
jgi:uncharacterized membrane protein